MTTQTKESRGDLDTSLMRAWNTLAEQKASLEDKMRRAKEDIANLEVRILDNLSRSGTDSVKVQGRSFFVRIERWARALDGDKAAAIKALKASGNGQMVAEAFNTQSVSALVREIFADAEAEGREVDWPNHPLSKGLEFSETPKLGTRKS